MTDNQLITHFKDRPLLTGWVKFSSFELTDDLPGMINIALERIQSGHNVAAVSREVLIRLWAYLGLHCKRG